MPARRRTAAAVAALLVAPAVAVVAAGPAAAADVRRPLPIGAYADMVVDPGSGYAFVAGTANDIIDDGYAGGVVAVRSDGSSAQRIAGTTDSRAVTVGPDGLVYAAELDGHVVVIDPATRTVTASYDTGEAAACPDAVAFAGSALWIGYGGCPSATAAGLAVMDPVSHEFTPSLTASAANTPIRLKSVPGHDDELLATGLAAADHLQLLAVSGSTATVAHDLAGVSVSDFAVSPDGATVAATTNAGAQTFSTADLSAGPATYGGDRGRRGAVAYSADGHYVATAEGDSAWSDLVDTYGPDSAALIRTYDTSTPGSAGAGQNTNPAARGLAWSGHALLAVYVDYLGGYPLLKVLTQATLQPTTLTLTGRATATRATALTLTGTLTTTGGGLAGARLSVTKKDLRGTHTLSSVTTTGTGAFTVHDTPQVGSTNTYTVGFAGDALHAPATRSFAVTVSRATPSLTIRLNQTHYSAGQTATATVHLGTTYRVRTVSVYARVYPAAYRLLRTAAVDRNGNLRVAARVSSRTIFSARFAGDDRYGPRSAAVSTGAVKATIHTSIRGYYGRSGSYYLFHASRGGTIAATVRPANPNLYVDFVLQVYYGGRWQTVDDASFHPDRTGNTARIAFLGAKKYKWRLRGGVGPAYVNSTMTTAGATARWWYVEFR